MHLNCVTTMYIMPDSGALRGSVLVFTNIKNYKITAGWDEMMATGEITIPRRLKDVYIAETSDFDFIPGDVSTWIKTYQDNLGRVYSEGKLTAINQTIKNTTSSVDDNITGYGKDDIFKRGSLVALQTYYQWFDSNNDLNSNPNNILYTDIERKTNTPRSQIFTGYITSVNSGADLKIKVADYMYFFQQLKIPNAKYSAKNFTLGKMIDKVLTDAQNSYSLNQNSTISPIWLETEDGAKLKFTIENWDIENKTLSQNKASQDSADNINIATVGDIKCENATVGMFLKELKHKYMMVPYFYPCTSWLNITPFKYNPEEISEDNPYGYQVHTFGFQKNIIDSKLEYKRKDDVLVGAYIKSAYKQTNEETTTDGINKTENKTIQYFVGQAGGDIKTFFYTRQEGDKNLSLKEAMIARGEELLKQTVYTGYYGSFTTLGYPCIRHGDIVILKDEIYPERDGAYRVKKVESNGGETTGLRQTIYIDIKVK